MGVSLLIDGVERKEIIKFGSLRVSNKKDNATDTCNFVIEGHQGQLIKPELNAAVIIEVDGIRTFGGVIIKTDQQLVGKLISYSVTVKDWSQYLDRKMVIERYENETLHDIIIDLVDRYGVEFGFTANSVTGQTVEVASISFNEITMSDALQKLARLTNYSWYIDEFKDLHFFKKNEEMAPFSLTDTSDNYIFESLVIIKDLSQIRNKIKIRGGEAEAEVATKKWAGDSETDIFGTDHKFVSLPVVEVDGTPVTVGVDYQDQDVDFDCMWNFLQKYIRFTAGNIPDAPISGTTNIDITGIPLRPLVVVRQDNASIAKYGEYEFTMRNDSLKTRDEALQFAQAQLALYANSIKEGEFRTYVQGLRSGQTIVVNSVLHDVAESFLIQSVTFQQITPELYGWQVELATLRTVGILDILQALLLQEAISEGEDETLLNFFSLSDLFAMSDLLGTITATTTEDYLIEQNDPGSDTYPNPAVVNKSTIAA